MNNLPEEHMKTQRFVRHRITAKLVREVLGELPLQPKNLEDFVKNALRSPRALDEVWVGHPSDEWLCGDYCGRGTVYMWHPTLRRHAWYGIEGTSLEGEPWREGSRPRYAHFDNVSGCLEGRPWGDRHEGSLGRGAWAIRHLNVHDKPSEIETSLEPYLRMLRHATRVLVSTHLSADTEQHKALLESWQQLDIEFGRVPFTSNPLLEAGR